VARRRIEPPLDPFERAARRVDPEYAQLAEAAVPPKSMRAPRLLLVFAVVVVAVALTRSTGGSALKRSCTTPGFAIAHPTVDLDAPLTWSVTGPATDHLRLTIDDDTTPVAGPQPLTGCLVHGSFRVPVGKGRHTLTATVTTTDGTVSARLGRPFTVR
jgi:hypothetical protein